MSEKILLVDDEKEFIETLAERMKTRGMEVWTTTSAKEALKMVDTQSFDAIVLDLIMPEMDGIEALSILKSKNPDLQIILLTGQATIDKGIEAMKLGAMDFIEKPADLEMLTNKIKKAKAKKMVLVEKKNQEKIQNIIMSKGW